MKDDDDAGADSELVSTLSRSLVGYNSITKAANQFIGSSERLRYILQFCIKTIIPPR
jgi:hypothetical protein